MLKAGFMADFIVINDNPFSDTFVNDSRPLTDINIEQTYVNGDKIYEIQ